jgi:FtsH-binding integral membrane protein
MKKHGNKLAGQLPHQPPAGKLAYEVFLSKADDSVKLSQEPVILRFKGAVPDYILIPHILLMFAAMLFSTRAGLEVVLKRKRTVLYTTVTVITLFLGGLILGPVVQNYAFGDYWTGWPFGQDMTDNKTLVSFLVWAFALYKVKRNNHHRAWVFVAAVVLLAIYLIPHSMFGSELNYESGQVETGKN